MVWRAISRTGWITASSNLSLRPLLNCRVSHAMKSVRQARLQPEGGDAMITRRNCILSGLGAALSARISGAAEFWNSKEPAEWSEEDISRVLNRSPWAKDTTLPLRQDLLSG